MFREIVLGLASRPEVQTFFSHEPAARDLALRFVAGETMDDGLRAARRLNARGMSVTLDHLGEHTTTPREARAAAEAYRALLDRITAEGLDANVSLKLTQLGLDVDEDVCERYLAEIVERADEVHSFVRIDMESSAYTERTLAMFRRVRERFPGRVGPVIQAYLYRSEQDVRDLIKLGARVRLCKGAYAEPPTVAFQDKAEVDLNFVRLMELLLLLGRYPAIATHDEAIVEHAIRFARLWDLGREQFEFQMLYGVRRDLQAALVDAGYRLRVYVPFGSAWYPYLARRLAERPANVWFVLGNLAREALAGPA